MLLKQNFFFNIKDLSNKKIRLSQKKNATKKWSNILNTVYRKIIHIETVSEFIYKSRLSTDLALTAR